MFLITLDMKKSFTEKKPSKPKVKIKSFQINDPAFILKFNNSTDSYSEFPNLTICDLYLPKIVNKGKDNERVEFKWVCSPTFSKALDYIIFDRIKGEYKGKGDEGLSKFYEAYSSEKKKIYSLFDNLDWMTSLKFDENTKSYILNLNG